MEILAGFAALILVAAGLLLTLRVSFWILVAVVLPILWICMLVDAVVRRDEDYPSKSANEKILWIVMIVAFPISAAVYWFMVYRAGKPQQTVDAGAQLAATQVSAAPSPPSAV